ncbi:hypothetical protein D6821_00850 [Candidatus Parcubacteria bacterium]|nr:MAG: hypothetical protein D6821_00850 [Candidatus Parcubacteria bacterium]
MFMNKKRQFLVICLLVILLVILLSIIIYYQQQIQPPQANAPILPTASSSAELIASTSLPQKIETEAKDLNCNEIADPSQQNQCWRQQLTKIVQSAEVGRCQQLPDSLVSFCQRQMVTRSAIKKQNPEICFQQLSDDQSADICKTQALLSIALITRDIKFCQQITNRYDQEFCREEIQDISSHSIATSTIPQIDCSNKSCYWRVSQWSECPVCCGGGIKTREVWCEKDGKKIPEFFCDPDMRPLAQTACNSQSCYPLKVFVTSRAYSGDFGGLEEADKICTQLANRAGLCGQYRAWLSTYQESARDRLFHSLRPFARIDGQIIADNWTELTSGKLKNPINVDENGRTVERAKVWTGTNAAGYNHNRPTPATRKSLENCQNWTTQDAKGVVGSTFYTKEWWTDLTQANFGAMSCSAKNRLYCIQDINNIKPDFRER